MLLQLDTELLCCFLNAFPRFIAFLICHTLDLVEVCYGLLNVTCVFEGFFALFGEGELFFWVL